MHPSWSKSRLAQDRSACYVAAMSITAVVEHGVIKLPKDVPWASGTVVRVEAVEEEVPTLWEGLKDFDGMAEDAPADLAGNLDHYVHGHPRQ
jgi:hypothetical protein